MFLSVNVSQQITHLVKWPSCLLFQASAAFLSLRDEVTGYLTNAFKLGLDSNCKTSAVIWFICPELHMKAIQTSQEKESRSVLPFFSWYLLVLQPLFLDWGCFWGFLFVCVCVCVAKLLTRKTNKQQKNSKPQQKNSIQWTMGLQPPPKAPFSLQDLKPEVSACGFFKCTFVPARMKKSILKQL